jgi:hypothetical protein
VSEHGKEADVRIGRLLLAVAIGAIAYALSFRLPFAAGLDPRPGCTVIGVTALTITAWMSHAMPLGASSLLPVVLLPPPLAEGATNEGAAAEGGGEEGAGDEGGAALMERRRERDEEED